MVSKFNADSASYRKRRSTMYTKGVMSLVGGGGGGGDATTSGRKLLFISQMLDLNSV